MNRFVDAMIAQVGIPYPTLPISTRCIFIWQRTNDPAEQMNKFGLNRSIEQMNNEPMITRTNDSTNATNARVVTTDPTLSTSIRRILIWRIGIRSASLVIR